MEEPPIPSTVAPSRTSRHGEPDNRHFERLRWRCRRGLLELDLTLQNFLHQAYQDLTAAERVAFDKLLALPDNVLHSYLQGSQNPSDQDLMQLVSKLRIYPFGVCTGMANSE